ncbi:xanthine dehydrogenase family protein molybdopterin-binding subunit [Bradyrhizobium sp.]|uniref:xanthine dehydrogenase family protein molybdopterin-binding subunit n=1 Tax=Bradyrhizobium sp. TaxID=376 RepID=UPI001DE14F82|nr:xanthine dehydrogenase family protein molybdopterin-binding subunit [Bradyrhizobium sp.]MBI5317918.1 xanthine dehydrogenase family protein molybdopterin-binding subunit [Bradyrhizobium sp.]
MSVDLKSIAFGSDRGAAKSGKLSLVLGQGRYSDDVRVPGQVHAVFVRSTVSHAIIGSIDIKDAAKMPGVLAIFTGADLAADGIGEFPILASAIGRDGKPMLVATAPVLAVDRVKHSGEPVAIVVAESENQAADAAEAVLVHCEPLRPVLNIEDAMKPGAPQLSEHIPSNIVLDWTSGDLEAVEAAFKSAHHIERIRLNDDRVAAVSMEPRSGIANWDEQSGRFTLITATQGVAVVRKVIAESVLKVPVDSLRVLTDDVGGGFGMKIQAYSEYAAILYASKKLNRTVRWKNSRLESFLSDTQGRGYIIHGEIALDAEGRILALRVNNMIGLGAYTSPFTTAFSTVNTKNCLSSVYKIPAIEMGAKVVLTNMVPLGPYRGAGRPEAIYVVERLIEAAARSMKIDCVELRRRNLIGTDAFPYQTAVGPIYDSGEFEAVMDKALELSNWRTFPERRAEAETRGKIRGIGICCFLEVAGAILNEKADIRFSKDGYLEVRMGAQEMGQGFNATMYDVIASQVGVPVDRVKLIQGDSDEIHEGLPSLASRSLMMAGNAAVLACRQAIEKGLPIAARVFESAQEDIEYRDGHYRIAGTDLRLSILDIPAKASSLEGDLDETVLNTVAEFVSPQLTFPNGCHVCEVEIDPDTGVVAVVNFTAVDDVGNVMNEAAVCGQIHGGVVQGLGQVLGEQVVYNSDGQLLTSSLMDYFMPRASDVSSITTALHVVPCTNNPLGVKGAGESGVAGALPASMNAVLNALAGKGIDHFDMPATPYRLWQALQHASS